MTHFNLNARIRQATADCHSVLELGTMFGERLAVAGNPERCVRIGVDAHLPYLERAVEMHPNAIYFHKDITQWLYVSEFVPVNVDVVLLIDIIEHFNLAYAKDLIRCAQRIARKRVVAFVPIGNHPQDSDPYGLGGEHWQIHRSTWEVEDLEEMGFEVEHLPRCHRKRGKDRGAAFCTWEPIAW